ncbi:uncharacterized protein [Penaeus vannamei]|uniref:uncharacterized protein n=1 Tax=Penaeus vannamei TaxID=6689 RepID=UPI00387F9B5F
MVKNFCLGKTYELSVWFPLVWNRSLSPTGGEFVRSASHSSFDSRSLPRRAPSAPPSQKRGLDEENAQGGGGWELGGSHLQQPFTGEGGELSDGEGEDAESIFSHMDMLSPSHHTDAQTLALMLQEQLDAINNEIRYVCERCFKHWYIFNLKVIVSGRLQNQRAPQATKSKRKLQSSVALAERPMSHIAKCSQIACCSCSMGTFFFAFALRLKKHDAYIDIVVESISLYWGCFNPRDPVASLQLYGRKHGQWVTYVAIWPSMRCKDWMNMNTLPW